MTRHSRATHPSPSSPRYLLFLLLALLLAPAVRAKTSLLIPGKGFGTVQLGAEYVDFAPAFGKPKKVTTSTEDPSIKMVWFESFAVQVNHDGKVIGITVLSPDYRTSEGLGVGSTNENIQKALGAGLVRGESGRVYPSRGIGFMFSNGKAAYVLVFKAEEGAVTPLLGDRLLIGGQRAGDLRLGMPFATVQKAWGSPSGEKPMGPGRTLADYQKEGVRFVVGGGKVEAILVTTGDFISASGIKVGGRRAEIEKKLGPAPSHKGDGIFYPKKGVGFLLATDEIREIQILAPEK